MRIVYTSWEYPPQYGGGIGTYVHAMAHTLAARGHQVSVVTVTDHPYPTRAVEDGVLVVRLPVVPFRGDDPVAMLRGWQQHADAVAACLRKLVRGGRVDVIELCDYRGEGATFLHSTTPEQRPVCITRLHTPSCVLNHYNTGHTRTAVLEEFEKQALLASDRLVSPSRALAGEMQSRFGPDVQIDLSPHPVNPRFLEPLPLVAEGAEALYVGRFEERKGVETLAHAAEAFLTACPDARLTLIGGDTTKSPARPSMRAVVREAIPRGLRSRVELIDRIMPDELIERYRAARFCVFPSHFENFPNTCLEAMALGKCVIGTTNSGMAEMIEPDISGVIVPAADTAALSAALIRVHRMSDDERRAMGAAARRRIDTCFHPDVIAANLERQYADFMAAHSYRPPVPTELLDTQPPVAVVIPCYNHGKFLPETLDSVRAQDYPRIECVVVDDGSTDPATLAALRTAHAGGQAVIRQENQGLSAARNAGVQATTAPFYVALDADDKLAPDFISRLLPPLLENPALGYCYSHAQFFDAAAGVWECPPYDPQRLLVENLSVATAVVRRAAYDEVGGYSRDMIYGFEDWDFWIALLDAGYHGHCVPAPLFHYRKHAGGSMLSETQKRRGEMVRQMIAHHRELFALSLDVSIARKDAMFFQAHMDAWHLRESLVQQSARTATSSADDNLYQSLLAQAELDYIEGSRFWRLTRRLQRNVLGRLLFGRELPTAAGDGPERRLAHLKASRAYRLIQAAKRTAVYKWYGRRRWGTDFDQPPAATRP